MTRTEVSRNFCVSESLLSSYEASGLILCSQDTAGEPIYQAQEIQLVGLISSLLDSGMEQEALRRYISLRTEAKDTRPEQVRILRRHRAKLLDDLHGCQAALDHVDYIIYETEKGRKNS
ncbi:MAG: MerR family transcriptional regulator [Lachnospiraceae bacterium]|nr:MerR family transcriptional regulator [Lachnospiraceae bacterium]